MKLSSGPPKLGITAEKLGQYRDGNGGNKAFRKAPAGHSIIQARPWVSSPLEGFQLTEIWSCATGGAGQGCTGWRRNDQKSSTGLLMKEATDGRVRKLEERRKMALMPGHWVTCWGQGTAGCQENYCSMTLPSCSDGNQKAIFWNKSLAEGRSSRLVENFKLYHNTISFTSCHNATCNL